MSEQNKNISPPHAMLPGPSLRVDQLRPHASIIMLCQASCGTVSDIAVAALQATVPGYRAVEQLGYELPCRGCGMRGDATIDARRALRR